MDRKLIWSCLLVLVLTTVGVYGISFSNDPAAVAAAVAAAAAVVVAAAVTVDGDYLLAVGLSFLAGAMITILVASWEEERNNFSPSKLIFLLGVFLVALNPFVVTSRYHNLSQLERDKAIVEAMQLNLNGKVELGLPVATSAAEQSYLKQVLTVTVGEEQHPWREAIRCQEGPAVWYKLVLATEAKTISLKFRHLWWNHEAVKKLLE